jgi:hypothetical protein
VFPVGIGLRDPRSQKRDLGHPSIHRFDNWRGHRLRGTLHLASGSDGCSRDHSERVTFWKTFLASWKTSSAS